MPDPLDPLQEALEQLIAEASLCLPRLRMHGWTVTANALDGAIDATRAALIDRLTPTEAATDG